MTATTHHRLVLVDVLDPATGFDIGLSVAVEVFFVTEKYEYGADADDRQGVPCEDVTVLEVYANPSALHGLSEAQVQQVKDDAARIVEKG